jgi:hypothetical protein
MPDCRGLDPARHEALSRITNKAGKRGVWRVSPSDGADDLGRNVLRSGHARGRGQEILMDLYAEGFICGAEGGGFEVLYGCLCSPAEISRTTFVSSLPQAEEPASLAGCARWVAGETCGASAGGLAAGGAQQGLTKSVTNQASQWSARLGFVAPETQRPRLEGNSAEIRLAQDVFPDMLQECGIRNLPGELGLRGLKALLRNFKAWQAEGVSLDTITEMIWEFGRHPEWCRRSRNPAWMVFVTHKEELVSRVATRRKRNGVAASEDAEAWRLGAVGTDPMETHRYDVDWWLDRNRRAVRR